MIEIRHRSTGTLLYQSESSTTIHEAVIHALRSRTDLSGANLSGANLSRGDLSLAQLDGGTSLHRALMIDTRVDPKHAPEERQP